MRDSFLSFLIFFKKPVWLKHPDRFLIFAILLLLSSSCAATRQNTGQARAGKETGSTVIETDKNLQADETADGIFMDAVKAKILEDKAEAFKQFSRVAVLKPGNATAHYELSRLWLERRNIPKAIEEVRYALQRDSSNKWIYNWYASLLDVDGQYLKAAEIMARLAAREKAPEDFLQRQAILLQKAGKNKEALTILDKLSTYVGQDDEVLLLQKQQIYLSQNDVESAVGEVRKLISYYPQESRYMLLVGELYDNNGKDEEAIKAYKLAEEKFPEDSNIQFALVQYYLKNKDTVNFQHYLEKAILNKEVGVEERISLLAPFIQNRGQDPEIKKLAFDLTRKLAEQEPPQIESRLLYADLLAADSHLDSALAEYKKIIATDSVKFGAWQQLLLIYTQQQEYDSLIVYSERATQLFPKEQMVFYLGGLGYQLKGNYTDAERYLKNAISLHKDKNDDLLSEMLTALGDTYNSDKKFAASDSCYHAALALQPDNASALNNFSYYLSERGEKLDEAERMSAKSLVLRPGEATFLDTYGWVLYKQGKYKEAREYIQKAIDANKGDADATLYEHLGDIEFKIGNAAQALENWRKAQTKGNTSELLQQKINEQKLKE
jgi:tetratricopeptide (TPR) repeat protein